MPGPADRLPGHRDRLFNGGNGHRVPGGDYAVSSRSDQVPAADDGMSAGDHALSGGRDGLPCAGDALSAAADAMPGDDDGMPCGRNRMPSASAGHHVPAVRQPRFDPRGSLCGSASQRTLGDSRGFKPTGIRCGLRGG